MRRMKGEIEKGEEDEEGESEQDSEEDEEEEEEDDGHSDIESRDGNYKITKLDLIWTAKHGKHVTFF